jgi:hypothetical protein
MITAETSPDFEGLAARLTTKAKALAEAHAERTALARRANPARWRKPGLLWPLFTKG